MATISYKCNVCKRDIEILENTKGISVFSKCIITQGCKGKLYKTARNPNNVRESFPSPVSSLDDYTPRGKLFNFSQDILSSIWKINHNLGVSPAVDVYILSENGTYSLLPPDSYTFRFVDKDNIEIVFTLPQKGRVQCVARSSVPKTVNSAIPDKEFFQVTLDGTFNFAIPKFLTKYDVTSVVTPTPTLPIDLGEVTPSNIRIEISIKKPNEEEIICFETIPTTPLSSPWSGWTEILLRKRRNYYVRMKNILDFRTFDDAELDFDDIPNGTQLKFISIDYGTGAKQTIPSRGLFILLTNKPYAAIDKIRDRVIDVGELITLADQSDPSKNIIEPFIYKDGEFYIDTTNIETIYPSIERVT